MLRNQYRGRKIKLWFGHSGLSPQPWTHPTDVIWALDVTDVRCPGARQPTKRIFHLYLFIFSLMTLFLCLQAPVCTSACVWRPEITPWCRPSGPWFFRQGFSQFWGSLIRWGRWPTSPRGLPVSCSPALESQVHTYSRQRSCRQDGLSVWEDSAVNFWAAHPSNSPVRKRLVSHTFCWEYIS